MKAAVIGAGNMGGAIARGIAQGNRIRTEDLTVSNPSPGKLEALQAAYPALHVTSDNRAAASGADLVILAVKPWKVEEVLSGLGLVAGQVLVSVAAGVSFADLERYAGVPGIPLFRVIPNTAVACLESLTLIASCHATPQQEAAVTALFDEMGLTVRVEEAQMGAGTSLASCGIAYVFKYVEAAVREGVAMGLDAAAAKRMVAQSLRGAAAILLEGDADPAAEIVRVCTPGGLTERGIRSLEADGFPEAVAAAMRASNPQES